MSEFVTTYNENNVLHIELNRLDKKNSLNSEMYLALYEALSDANSDDSIKVILFKGGRGCFCAGNDIADFLSEDAIAPGSPISNFLHLLADMNKPMIATVSGPAIGIGTTLLLHCDLVYATDKAIFSLPFVNLSVCAEAGSSYLLSRQIGHARASELILFGDAFNAETALSYGLINEIMDEENYWELAQEKAEAIARKPSQALMVNKALMKADNKMLHQVIDNEIAEFAKLLKTEDAKAIFKKFLQR